MSTSNTDTTDTTDDQPAEPTYSILYEAKVPLDDSVSLSDSEAVVAVADALSKWDTTDIPEEETATPWTCEYRGLEHDPTRPALGISLRVTGIPESEAPGPARQAIQQLLDALGAEIGNEFGSAADVGVIR
jgi:hypothetical protein